MKVVWISFESELNDVSNKFIMRWSFQLGLGQITMVYCCRLCLDLIILFCNCFALFMWERIKQDRQLHLLKV